MKCRVFLCVALASYRAAEAQDSSWGFSSFFSAPDGESDSPAQDFHPNPVIGGIERVSTAITNLPQAPRRAIQGVAGLTLLRYGNHFTNSVLFVQAFRSSAMPVIRRALPELRASYTRAAAAAKEEAPKLIEAKDTVMRLKDEIPEALAIAKTAMDELTAVTRQVAKTRAALADSRTQASDDGLIDGALEARLARRKVELERNLEAMLGLQDKAKQMAENAQGSLATLHEAMAAASLATGGVNAIMASVDPELVGDLLKGLTSGVMQCVAVATAPAAGSVTIGTDLGGAVGARAAALVDAQLVKKGGVPEPARKWARQAANGACVAGCTYVAFKFKRLVLTASAVGVGASLVVGALEGQVEQSLGVKLAEVQVFSSAQAKAARELAQRAAEKARAQAAEHGGDLAAGLVTSVASRAQAVALPTSASGLLTLLLPVGAMVYKLTDGEGGELPWYLRILFSPFLALELSLRAIGGGKADGAAL